MRTVRTDCLVIGCGLAGAGYAYQAAKAGLQCILLSGEPSADECNSARAQGGIVDPTVDPQSLRGDIMTASAGAADPRAIDFIVERGGPAVRELVDELDVPFERDDRGELRMTREAAHSAARILFAKDQTGKAIVTALHRAVTASSRIEIALHTVAVDLLTLSHSSKDPLHKYEPLTCFGAYALDVESGEVYAIVARKTVLATGGLGQIYLHSTNFPSAYGHGVAMGYRVGARVIDLEYVQFHPTVFTRKDAAPFLISEALRGEGGHLVDAAGRRFMEDHHPDGSLAPRDVIARSITFEMIRTGAPSVFIDLADLEPGYVTERFPTIYRHCLQAGVDITREPIPVVPAAHYSCGGLHTDLYGRTNIVNLSAVGEAACTGFHGANRLASTSLLECVTMAREAAADAAAELAGSRFEPPEVRPWEGRRVQADEDLIQQDLNLIKATMWNYVGLIRTGRRLQRARDMLRGLDAQVDDFYRGYAVSKALLNLRNAVQTALLVVYAAYHNTRSIGCHYRDDRHDGP
jgi:L-aspartate oxidase